MIYDNICMMIMTYPLVIFNTLRLKIADLQLSYRLTMVIFQSFVSLPEGKWGEMMETMNAQMSSMKANDVGPDNEMNHDK